MRARVKLLLGFGRKQFALQCSGCNPFVPCLLRREPMADQYL